MDGFCPISTSVFVTIGQGALNITCGKSRTTLNQQGYTRIHVSVNSPHRRSIDGGCRLQVYLLPFALYDALADLGSRLTLLIHRVGVVELLKTNRALGPVYPLKAAMETIVAHATVAVAIAWLLVQHGGHFGR